MSATLAYKWHAKLTNTCIGLCRSYSWQIYATYYGLSIKMFSILCFYPTAVLKSYFIMFTLLWVRASNWSLRVSTCPLLSSMSKGLQYLHWSLRESTCPRLRSNALTSSESVNGRVRDHVNLHISFVSRRSPTHPTELVTVSVDP